MLDSLIVRADFADINDRDNTALPLVNAFQRIEKCVTGDITAAVENYLYRLNLPMAVNLQRHKRWDKTFYAPLYEDPAVATRLSQLDTEFAQLRDQVSEMMQEPEWDQ